MAIHQKAYAKTHAGPVCIEKLRDKMNGSATDVRITLGRVLHVGVGTGVDSELPAASASSQQYGIRARDADADVEVTLEHARHLRDGLVELFDLLEQDTGKRPDSVPLLRAQLGLAREKLHKFDGREAMPPQNTIDPAKERAAMAIEERAGFRPAGLVPGPGEGTVTEVRQDVVPPYATRATIEISFGDYPDIRLGDPVRATRLTRTT